MTLSYEGNVTRGVLSANQWLLAALGAIALGTAGAPLIRQIPTPIKTGSLVASVAASAAFTALALQLPEQQKLAQVIKGEQIKQLKRAIAHEDTYQASLQEMQAKTRLFLQINKLPEPYRSYYAVRFNLQGLLGVPAAPALTTTAEEVAAPTAIALSSQQTASIEDLQEPEELAAIDTSWITPDFIRASKGVFGGKGSGKTTWFNYEAALFLKQNPNGVLWLGDIHYSEEEDGWLPGLPRELFREHFLVSKADQVLARLRNLRLILRKRIEEGDRKGAPYKFIIDEFAGCLRRWSEDEKEEALEIVEETQDEGRKYGVNVSLGLHSIKKNRIGIDASVLFQMDLLFLGRALSDGTTKWPDDLDADTRKQIIAEQQMLEEETGGRAAALRRRDDDPSVVSIPNITQDMLQLQVAEEPDPWADAFEEKYGIDPDRLTDDVPEVDVYEEMGKWFKLNPGADDQAIIQKFLELSGKLLNAHGVGLLRERFKAGN